MQHTQHFSKQSSICLLKKHHHWKYFNHSLEVRFCKIFLSLDIQALILTFWTLINSLPDPITHMAERFPMWMFVQPYFTVEIQHHWWSCAAHNLPTLLPAQFSQKKSVLFLQVNLKSTVYYEWTTHRQSWFFLVQLDVYWVAGCIVASISLLIVALYQNRTDFLNKNNPCTFINKMYFSVATKSKVPGDLAVYTGFVVAVCVFTCVLLVIVFVLYYKKQQLHCAVHTSVIPGKNNRFFYLTFF